MEALILFMFVLYNQAICGGPGRSKCNKRATFTAGSLQCKVDEGAKGESYGGAHSAVSV